jgi:hypothetical protein
MFSGCWNLNSNPVDVDVTTEYAGSEAFMEISSLSDTKYCVRVLISLMQ